MNLSAETVVKLLQVKGIGRMKIFALAKLLPSNILNDVDLAELITQYATTVKIPSQDSSEILQAFLRGSELFAKSKEMGIRIISYSDNDYPNSLREITAPPIILNVLGNLKAITNMPSVAVIGTRQPSNYGRQIGERIGYKLGANNINVVSGLALGCDSAAHIGCLRAHGITTAVLAHGLDSIYPKENSGLAQSILDNNGCLVSEYLLKTRGQPNFFIERDRIQAGLSKCTIVVETDTKGGTLHTVKNTLEYKRILAAFFHPLDKRNDKSRGNEMLISSGDALKIENQDDLDAIIKLIKPIDTQITKSDGKSIEAIQMPFFDLEALVIKDYQFAKPKKKTKNKKKKKLNENNLGSIIQKKLYE